LCWSRDSRYVAFLEYKEGVRANIRLLNTDTDSISAPLEYTGDAIYFGYAGGLVWSPDNKYIVYAASDSMILYHAKLNALPVDLDKMRAKAPPVQISEYEPGVFPAWPTFTKDGSFDLYVYDVSTGTERRVTASHEREHCPYFSSDGKSIYYTLDGKLFSIPTTGGTSRQSIKNVKLGEHIVLIPDGESMLSTLPGDTTQIVLYNNRTHKINKLTGNLFFPKFVVSPNGDQVVSTKSLYNVPDSSSYEHLVLLDIATGGRKILVTRFRGHSMSELCWFKNENAVYYESLGENDELLRELIDVPSGKARQFDFKVENLYGIAKLASVHPNETEGLLRVQARSSNVSIWKENTNDERW
jgi:Tol biopolymer transport system component